MRVFTKFRHDPYISTRHCDLCIQVPHEASTGFNASYPHGEALEDDFWSLSASFELSHEISGFLSPLLAQSPTPRMSTSTHIQSQSFTLDESQISELHSSTASE